MSVRKASHAGSWYSDSAKELGRQLDGWLEAANFSQGPARAIIAPHAGYRYCGSCAGFAYKQIDPSNVKRVFILGPSHHVRLSGCALSSVAKYRTPFYDLNIDTQVYKELQGTGCFEWMSLETDEDEHSIEMHLPYIAKVFEKYGNFGLQVSSGTNVIDLVAVKLFCFVPHVNVTLFEEFLKLTASQSFRNCNCNRKIAIVLSHRDISVVPILVGSLSPEREIQYGRLLSKYLADPSNCFIISSDFCHWGQRFRYTHYDKSCGEIYQSIQRLDQQGMSFIEMLDTAGFTEYLKKYGNTICGRHPIGVLLNMVDHIRETSNGLKVSLKFVDYAQSSQCRSFSDSSVSYASAALRFE